MLGEASAKHQPSEELTAWYEFPCFQAKEDVKGDEYVIIKGKVAINTMSG